jgi:ribosomal protein S18 acetylase RimI-like enzyme
VQTRPATLDDVPALLALQQRYDTHWFGAPEHDEDELLEDVGRVDPLSENSMLLLDGDRLLGAAWWWGTNSNVLADPDAPREVFDAAIAWLSAAGVEVLEALSRDTGYVEALGARGWRHDRSQFELIRDLSDDWVLSQPKWPAGVHLTGLQDPPELYRLIYELAGWTEVPGHQGRSFEEWTSIFLTDAEKPDEQVLAWQDGRLIGCALGRVFSDGTGWVAQLAVDRACRRRGLGRALLLEAIHRRVAAGAQRFGLGVSADNETALGLYLGVGLTIDREWQDYHRP